jgi:hypothetical protein
MFQIILSQTGHKVPFPFWSDYRFVLNIDDLNDIEISDSDIGSIDELIVKQLTSIQDHVKDDIDAKLLVELYSGLKIETDGNE